MIKPDKPDLEKKVEQINKEEPRIDPDVSPYEEHNRETAEELGWRYSSKRKCYVDSDGEIIADKFGQPLG